MSIRTKYLKIYLFLTFMPFSCYATDDLSLKLLRLMGDGRYFESKEIYKENNRELTPDIDLFYKFRMAEFMDKKDSASFYLEKMLLDYPGIFESEEINFYAILFDFYISQRDSIKGKYTYNRMKEFLEKNPYEIDENEMMLWKNGMEERWKFLREVVRWPPITVKRKKENKFLKMEGKERLLVDIKLNGMPEKTYFDTGVGHYYLLNRKMAEKFGIRCDVSEMVKARINETEMFIKYVNVDSIEIGNITVYNVPVSVFEYDIMVNMSDSLKNDSRLLNLVDSTCTNLFSSVVGLPLMQLIGKFQIDYENQEIIFPDSDSNSCFLKEPNLFFYDSQLYTHMQISKHDFTGFLDTGSDAYLHIDTTFYESYSTDMPIDTVISDKLSLIMMAHQVWHHPPYKVPYKPVILFDNKYLQLPAANSIKIYPLYYTWPGKYLDGVVGYDFFKRIGRKVLLDLDNMRLEAIE